MHEYSLDTEVRRKVHGYLVIIAMSAPTFFESCRTFLGLSPQLGIPISFGALYGVLFFLYDRILWRHCPTFFPIPNLNGKWKAEGVSSFQNPDTGENFRFTMDVIIKQTFSHIEVFTQTGDSTSRSTMANISTQHAVPIFRYTFENTPKSMANEELQRHPGMIELRIETEDCLKGDYFSGKHRLRYGELTLRRE